MTPRTWGVGTALLALAAFGCSDPVPPAPRGNLVFNLTGCTTFSGAVGADRNADPNTRFAQLPATDGSRPGRRVEDGAEGASLRCKVDGGDTNTISAQFSGVQSHPSAGITEFVGIDIRDGWIQKTETGGVGEANITLQTGGTHYTTVPGTTCSLTLDSSRDNNQFTVDAGRVYARFDCLQMEDAPTMGCSATGAFVFERCDED